LTGRDGTHPKSRSATLRRRVRSWWDWPRKEKAELVELVILAIGAEIAVRLVRLPSLTRRLGITLVDGAGETAKRAEAEGHLPATTIERRAASVDRLYRAWPRRNSCLRRALVLGFCVREAHPTMRIGVAKEGDEIRAHAWIEVNGRVVGDESGDYAPLRRTGEATT
jgi:transglutaminase superfamily protein